MKKKKLILMFLISLSSFSQNAYFLNKKGEKILMKDNSVEIIVIDDRISYSEVGKTWEKYIRFKDLDYAIVGPYYFKSFQLINSKGKPEKESAYFVITETENKKLLVYSYTLVGKYGSTDFYSVYIVDNNNNIIFSEKKFTYAKQHLDKRKNVVEMIKNHFSESSKLMSEFNQFINNDEDSLGILKFLSEPKYIKNI